MEDSNICPPNKRTRQKNYVKWKKRLCKVEEESSLDLFTNYPLVCAIWFNSLQGLRPKCGNLSSPNLFIQTFLSLSYEVNSKLILFGAMVCDVIWRARNQAQFEGMSLNVDRLIQKIPTLSQSTRDSRPHQSAHKHHVFNFQFLVFNKISGIQKICKILPPNYFTAKIQFGVLYGRQKFMID